MTKGLIFDIRKFSVHDGPGIRTTVFFKGCPLSCWWCHNPESRSPQPESGIRSLPLDGKHYCYEEVTGREMTLPEVMTEILKDRIFFEESNGGVTLSGGEPLLQADFARELLKTLKDAGLHTAVDTCGHVPAGELEKVIPFTDLFLYDLKLLDDQEHFEYTGVSNKLILENLACLVQKRKNIAIRFPVIPGITDTRENTELLKIFLKSLQPGISQIHLLPYHNTAQAKYERLGIENKVAGKNSLDKKNLEPLRKELSDAGFQVILGG